MFAHELARINTNVVFVGQGYALSLQPHKLVLQVAPKAFEGQPAKPRRGVGVSPFFNNRATPTGFLFLLTVMFLQSCHPYRVLIGIPVYGEALCCSRPLTRSGYQGLLATHKSVPLIIFSTTHHAPRNPPPRNIFVNRR